MNYDISHVNETIVFSFPVEHRTTQDIVLDKDAKEM
jgi:hypothetical protein